MAALTKIDRINTSLSKIRQITTFIQIVANERGMDAGPEDGLWGPGTNAAF